MRKSIVALLLLSVVLVLVSCLNKPVIIKPETTTNEIELNTHDTETICTTTSSDDNPIEHPVVVYYSDFGAIGDGKTDDFGAIFAAHEYANENNYSVKATEGATYLISSESIGKQIEIKTDTDWTNASFIIDDSVVEVQENKYYTLPIFRMNDACISVIQLPRYRRPYIFTSNIRVSYTMGMKYNPACSRTSICNIQCHMVWFESIEENILRYIYNQSKGS